MNKSLKEILTKDNQLRQDAPDILKSLDIDQDKQPNDRQRNSILKAIALLDSGVDKSEAYAQAKQEQFPALVVSAPSEIALPENGVDQAILDVAIAGLQARTQQGLLDTISRTLDTMPPAIANSAQHSLCASLQDRKFVDDTNAKIRAMLTERYGL